MVKRLVFILVAFLTATGFAATHVAVLETVSENGVIGRSEKMFLTDKIRERAKAVLPAYMGYVVMTRENINAMLPIRSTCRPVRQKWRSWPCACPWSW